MYRQKSVRLSARLQAHAVNLIPSRLNTASTLIFAITFAFVSADGVVDGERCQCVMLHQLPTAFVLFDSCNHFHLQRENNHLCSSNFSPQLSLSHFLVVPVIFPFASLELCLCFTSGCHSVPFCCCHCSFIVFLYTLRFVTFHFSV